MDTSEASVEETSINRLLTWIFQPDSELEAIKPMLKPEMYKDLSKILSIGGC